MRNKFLTSAGPLALVVGSIMGLQASSHREAPMITTTPKVDATDFYIFNSYEAGRSDYVTIVANYYPIQAPYGGPNFFMMDTNALYEIHVDNNGDAQEDITFQFRFAHDYKKIALPIGPEGNRRTNTVPVINVGAITAGNIGALNVVENYTLNVVRGDRRTGTSSAVTVAGSGAPLFTKPVDNIGNKSLPDYAAYANSYIYDVNLPGSETGGKLFVGQRKDPFAVNLGEAFDLLNLNPLGPVGGARDALATLNVTSLILEVPKAFLTSGNGTIATWTTASVITSTATNQVSRLGHALVNELVIGLKDKDLFNSARPTQDGALADYVTHPTFPAIVELLFGGAGVKAPTVFPRSDLVAVFLTGVSGLNQTAAVAEMLRLNTAIPAVPAAQQNNLGVIAGDNAGYPNGRRPGDDVVDITLRVAMGKLLPLADAPSGQLPYTDGADVDANRFKSVFPYLQEPLPGSPNDYGIFVTLQASNGVAGDYAPVTAGYDPATKKITTAKTGSPERFFRLQADGPVSFDNRVEVGAGDVKLGIKRP